MVSPIRGRALAPALVFFLALVPHAPAAFAGAIPQWCG